MKKKIFFGITLVIISISIFFTIHSLHLDQENNDETNNTQPAEGTPQNTLEPDISKPSDIKLYITEYMSRNKYIVFDEDGDACDWAEIYNPGEAAINLEGFAFSDTSKNIRKYVFPEVSIQPREYLVIYLSGKIKEYKQDKVLHANFSLSGGEELILTDKSNRIIDKLNVEDLPENISVGRAAEDHSKLLYYTDPSPGAINNTKSFNTLTEAISLKNKDIYINEVYAISLKKDAALDNKEVKEWVELYNNSSETILLKDYGLTDNIKEPYKMKFPDISIAPGKYMIIYTTGVNSYSGGVLQAAFKIKGSGENIYLVSKEGNIIDSFKNGYQKLGISSGRGEGASSPEIVYYSKPTPGAANTTQVYTDYSKPVEYSVNGGNIQIGTSITLSTKQDGAQIRYTLDGSEPNESSNIYNSPITITKNTSVRARTYSDGYLPGDIVTRTFLTDKPHDIPVVCLSTQSSYLFDQTTGIYKNYSSQKERPVHFEFYTENGKLGVDFSAGISLHGQYSRSEAQKSFSIDLRDAYGLSEVKYPFFRDFDINTFSSLLLRTSGQDWNLTKLKDAFCAQVIKGQLDVDYMEYRPAAVYINGEYWGLYNIREKVDKDYITAHSGIKDNDMDLIKANRNVKVGDMTQMNALREYFKKNDLSKKEVYEYVSSKIDIQNHIDYWITVAYLNNTDSGNIRYYNDKSGNHKWRWIMFDFDWAMHKATYNVYENMVINRLLKAGHGMQEMFDNSFNQGLFKNAEYKDKFMTEMGKHIKTTFDPERCIAILDKMAAEIDSEMVRHIERWGGPSSYEVWKRNIEGNAASTGLKEIIRKRPQIVIDQLTKRFNLNKAEVQKYFG